MTKILLFILLICNSLFFVQAQPIQIRMARNLPQNSPWEIELKNMALELSQISNDKIKLLLPQSLNINNEMNILQKMQYGIDAMLLTTHGLGELYPESLILSMPNLVQNDEEFYAALDALMPQMQDSLKDRFVIISIDRGGWTRLFSRNPIIYPEDLSNSKLSINSNDTRVITLLQSTGARVLRGDTATFILQLNSNTADTILITPIFIAGLWSQFRGKIKYVNSFNISPFLGVVLFNIKSWEKIPEDLKPKLATLVQRYSKKMTIQSNKLENDAMASLVKGGITITDLPAEAKVKWDTLISDRRESVINKFFKPETLKLIDTALAKVRKTK